MRDNSGLKAELDRIVPDAYQLATRYAARDTRLSPKTFPASCPYSFDIIMTREVGPEQD